jgi:CubicO group peptidase (beta-lactamase class C family)
MRIKACLLIFVVLSILVNLVAGTPRPTLAETNPQITDPMLANFEGIIQSEMEYFHIPGAAVAVIQDGQVVYSQGFGVRNVETSEPLTPQTRFRIGSTTKSMTSMLVAQLVDEGLLSWDTPITDIFPDSVNHGMG